jgi:hypothetical protein
MPKPNPLSQGLETQAPARSRTRPKKIAPKNAAPSREGRVMIGGFFKPEVHIALKIIAAKQRTTVQALLAQALDMLFAKNHEPEIASLP